jgi:nitrile hydratase accessory protein
VTADLEADRPFDEPWQPRVFAMTQALLETTGLDREEFRSRLVMSIADDPKRPYWESWLEALERLVAQTGVADIDELARARELH